MHGVAREQPVAFTLDEREGLDGVSALEARVEGGDERVRGRRARARLLFAPFDERAAQDAPEGVAHAL